MVKKRPVIPRREIEFGNHDWMRLYCKDEDVFIIGGGPSTKGFIYESLLGRRKIVCCHQVLFTPMEKGDVLVFHDPDPMISLEPEYDFYNEVFRTVVTTAVPLKPRGQVTVLPKNRANVSMNPADGLFSARSSGISAITLALIGGAKRIFLLGHDGGTKETHGYDAKNVKKHKINPPERYQLMVPHYGHFAKWKDKIFNMSQISRIPFFQRIDPREILGECYE